jgi:hypothetical protein
MRKMQDDKKLKIIAAYWVYSHARSCVNLNREDHKYLRLCEIIMQQKYDKLKAALMQLSKEELRFIKRWKLKMPAKIYQRDSKVTPALISKAMALFSNRTEWMVFIAGLPKADFNALKEVNGFFETECNAEVSEKRKRMVAAADSLYKKGYSYAAALRRAEGADELNLKGYTPKPQYKN